MQIPKDMIVSMIEQRLGGGQAQQAAQQLPDQVDHEQHAGLLSQFGIDPQELLGQSGGGGGYQGQSQQPGGGFQDPGQEQQPGGGGYQDPGQEQQYGGGGGYQDPGQEQQPGGGYQ